MKTRTNLIVPSEPSAAHLASIAMRMHHDFGLLPEYQQQNCLSQARQLYEEATGQGFYKITIDDLTEKPKGLAMGTYQRAQD